MTDAGSASQKDGDGKAQRGNKTATDSRKTRADQAGGGGTDADDNDTPVASRRATNVSVSDGEQQQQQQQQQQPRDARRGIVRSSSLAAVDATDLDVPLRLIVVSSKIRNSSVMHSAVLPSVVFVQYKYETATIDSCLGNLRSFSYAGPSAWNALPDYLKNSTLSLSVFINQLKHFLFSSY